jgi:lysozyme
MMLAAAALVIAAVLIPVAILRPSGPALKPPRAVETPASTPPVAEKPPPQITEAEEDLSRAQRFRMVEQETLKRFGPSALVSALARRFVFPHSRQDVIFGIDVSHHNQRNCQCDIDWARVAQQRVAFVVAKATEGIRFRDPHFRSHWEELARVPEIYRGAYHFLSADDDPVDQADFFLATMGPLRAVDMPPVLDLEWDIVVRSTRKWPKRDGDYWSQLSPNEILDRVLKWLDVVEKRTGRVPIVYTSRAWWDGRIRSDALLSRLKRYPIWLSAMEEKDLQVERPGTRGGWADKWNWTLWQFTNRGDLTKAGIPNPPDPRREGIDVNLFRGSVAEFRKAMGIVTPIVVAQTETKPGSGANAREAPPSDSAKDVTEPPREAAKEPVQKPPEETPKSETEVAAVPSDAAKPREAGGTGAAPEPSGTGAAPEAVKDAMKEPPAEPPKEAAKEPVPEPPKETAKEPGPEAPKEFAKEPAKESPPVTPTTESQVAAIAGSESDSKPDTGAGDSGVAAAPPAATEPKEGPAKETQVAGIPTTGASGPGGAVAPVNVQGSNSPPDSGRTTDVAAGMPRSGAALSASIIEIVLANGRVLRVHADIDPQVLMRFVVLLEK